MGIEVKILTTRERERRRRQDGEGWKGEEGG